MKATSPHLFPRGEIGTWIRLHHLCVVIEKPLALVIIVFFFSVDWVLRQREDCVDLTDLTLSQGQENQRTHINDRVDNQNR
jgi:hypothetical protein